MNSIKIFSEVGEVSRKSGLQNKEKKSERTMVKQKDSLGQVIIIAGLYITKPLKILEQL